MVYQKLDSTLWAAVDTKLRDEFGAYVLTEMQFVTAVKGAHNYMVFESRNLTYTFRVQKHIFFAHPVHRS